MDRSRKQELGAGEDTLPVSEMDVELHQEIPLPEQPPRVSEPSIIDDVQADVTPRSTTPPPDGLMYLRIHRANIMEEMIAHFKDPYIILEEIETSFVNERGIDCDGVSRDAYCSFWEEFFECASKGEAGRVPVITANWIKEEWKAIGRILLKGYMDHQYFPLQFSEAFIIGLIHGEEKVSQEILEKSFLAYLCSSDSNLVKMALKSDTEPKDNAQLTDFLYSMGCRSIPTQPRLSTVLLQVAHLELIQRPFYAMKTMAEAAFNEWADLLPSVQSVLNLYEEKKPTTQKVVKMLQCKVMNEAQERSLRYIKEFVRSLPQQSLRKFLHFLTGSDTAPTKAIQIIFTKLDGLARRPIAHACGPCLELPSTYKNYSDFRKEMEAILSNTDNFEMSIA
ncbi:uncharacterized protein LOC117292736 [Asterias rubens]|uniref:uncharacterized protein LOC117292736 n=1 Tax=Asterias rubens TaxID=7604 RepID=UPI001455232B|nr:uncharacterized protein LOC117292736 [Asterias rubens]XP_033630775.1 uncharacterized protein LOC117292736 [Asterias rubens]XP_033630777.1 uncharacterized protein LOC117292736 [Asterias rubens]